MVSHTLHVKWCIRLGVLEKVCREVNIIIDTKCGKHDVGRREGLVYIDAGGIKIPVIGRGRRYAGMKIGGLSIRKTYLDAEELAECLRKFYGEPIPDCVLKSAFLHHFLDEIKDIIKTGVIEAGEAEKIVSEVASRLEGFKNLKASIFEEVYRFLQKHAREVIDDVLKEV